MNTKSGKKEHRLCLVTAVFWTLAAAIQLVGAIVRTPTALQMAVLILFVICAIVWWLRYDKVKKRENDTGGRNHE